MKQQHIALISCPIPIINNGGYRKSVTQETVLQETVLQHRNSNSKSYSNRSNRIIKNKDFQQMGNLLQEKFSTKKVDIGQVPEGIKVAIYEISQEFGEKRNFWSNLTHLLDIIKSSGRSPDLFTQYIYEARSITKQQDNVKKKMPYFFSVIKDISGIKRF